MAYGKVGAARVGGWTDHHDGTDIAMNRGFHAIFRKSYNLRSLLRRVDQLSMLTPVDDYRLVDAVGGATASAACPAPPPWNAPDRDGRPRSAVIEATIARSERPRFKRARRAAALITPLMRYAANRLWRDDLAYAERRYQLRAESRAIGDRKASANSAKGACRSIVDATTSTRLGRHAPGGGRESMEVPHCGCSKQP